MQTRSKFVSFFFAVLFSFGGMACNDEPASMGNSTCSTNAECRGGEVCLGGMCSPVPTGDCQSDSDCTADQYCSMDTQTCVTMMTIVCTSDLDCPNGRLCDVAQAMCVACLTANDCSMGQMCVGGECLAPGADAGVTGGDDSGSTPTDGGTSNPIDAGQMLECTEDTECNPPDEICEANQCVFGCAVAGGITCAGNEICNPGTGRCVAVSCTMDSDCNPPQTVCESGQCVAGCDEMGGIQCMSPQTCDTMTGRCSGGMMGGNCMDDGSEPNDSIQGPTIIGGMSQLSNTSCPMNDDVYRVTLAQGDRLDVNLTFYHSDGNLDVEILDITGAVLASGTSVDDNEMTSYRAPRNEDYFIRVFMVADSGSTPGNSYDLSTAVTGQSCMSDALEPNDSVMSARPLQTGTQTSLWVCSTDTDYFSYSVNAGDPLAFEISFLPNEGGVSALLLDSTGTQVAAATSTMRGEVSVSHTAATQGTYYLQVFLTSDAGTVIGNSYTLQSTIGRPSAGCMTDQYEPNDSRSSAQPIMVGTHPNLYSCNLDDDNYLIDLTAGSVVTISADFSHAEGDIDLRLYGPSSLSTVADSVTFSAPETISNYVVATSGTHRIKITQYLDAGSFPGNSYTLSIAVR